MSDMKILQRTQLEGKDKYEYCPYCVQEAKENGKSWTELPPLFKLLTATYMDNYKRDLVETKWECPKCRRISDTETFIKYYCA